jgi:uncharacterized lipoprotein YajG
MRIQYTVICLLSVLFLTACKSNPSTPDNSTQQKSTSAEKESTQSTENAEGDRGFDPCKLNASLAICKKE